MTEKDLLISRIVDREDRPEDWVRLDQFAGTDRRVYDALVETLRGESALRQAVLPGLALADRVELRAPSFLARHSWLPQWSGWLTVAGLILVWLATDLRMRRTEAVPIGQDHIGQSPIERGPTEMAAKPELARTTVLRDLPNLMVETHPIVGSDQTEVIYVRRTLERAVVAGVYTLARDEIGQPIQTTVDLTRFTPHRSY